MSSNGIWSQITRSQDELSSGRSRKAPVHDQDCIVRRRNHLGRSRRVVERVPIGEAASPVSPIRKRVEHPRSEQPVLIAKVLISLYCVTAGLMARRVEVVD